MLFKLGRCSTQGLTWNFYFVARCLGVDQGLTVLLSCWTYHEKIAPKPLI